MMRWMSFAFIAVVATGASQPAGQQPVRGASQPIRWTPPSISTDRYESSAVFTPDGREIFFVTADRNFRGWRILRARCEPKGWSAPSSPAFAGPAGAIEADPFVTADGKRLYFVSSRHNPAAEDFDIWFVDRARNGRWGQPQRLPAPVNTAASELLPRVDRFGRLYFGSNRPGGHGQSDIYVATQNTRGRWSVRNVGPPVSTIANEYEAEVSRDGRAMVVVADHGDRSHLYLYRAIAGRWIAQGRVPANPKVFQVGPLLSPRGERLLFSQADGSRSGEIFLIDLVPNASEAWPPRC